MTIYQKLFSNDESSINLFRFGLSVFLAGISLVFFVCCRLIHSYFDILNYSLSLSIGLVIGIGLISFPIESLNSIAFRSILFLISISFTVVVMILVDFLWIEKPLGYMQIPSGLDKNDASNEPNSSLEISDHHDEEESFSVERESTVSSSIKKLQFYTYILMMIFFWNDLLRCAVIIPQKYLARDLMRLLSQKVSFSICIPSLLEDFDVTDRKFFLTMVLCSLSSPLGFVLAISLPARTIAAVEAFSNQWFCSCSAGVMTYVSLTYCLPRVLRSNELSSYQDDPKAMMRKKFIQMFAFLVGYAMTVTPYLFTQ